MEHLYLLAEKILRRPVKRPQKLALNRSHPAWWVASFGGAGCLPVAGTAGSLAALPVGWLITHLTGEGGMLAAVVLCFFIGTWAAQWVEDTSRTHDASFIVIDEVAGMWLTCLLLPATAGWGWWLLAFLLFRVADIVKPWPAGYIDRTMKNGRGVMLDDIFAGAYALVALELIRFIFS